MSVTSSPVLLKKRSDRLSIPLAVILAFIPALIYSQTETEVYLIDLRSTSRQVAKNEIRNLSDNDGYDNQPSFYNDSLILFSSTRNGQTDVVAYSLSDNRKVWKTDTPGGGEYSPTRIPGSEDFSAIRLDRDGKQLLYRYDWKSGKSKPLLDLKVGYHVWYNPELLVSAVLVEDRMDLVVSNLKDHTNYTFQRNVGRSLHRIPNTQLVSFVNREDGKSELKSVDPLSGATKVITDLPPGVQDVYWLVDGRVLAGSGSTIWQFYPGISDEWTVFRNLPEDKVDGITRMATHNDSGVLLFVAENP
ncbi:hypothetical protein [Muriicola marianensis]|uniref:Uncharacterized protein n=1 Tax=Muriicola marianensis TaxID=1324801 RepID=A0ABQ1R5C6_9FLAO|nr:hypothetical protein [Muriicola marianensis]GGD58768.1 hypothetical protein GCM10011361_26420 [Muriicola marianensis]